MIKGVDFTGISIVYLCHDAQGNFLMQKRGKPCRDEQGRWDCGGGALEFGDTVEKTLAKEIKEEYGVKIIKSEFLGFRDVHRENNGNKTHWVALDFKVLVSREKVKNNEPNKFDEIGWFKLNKLPASLHSQLPIFFEKYKDKL